jgi:ABC-type multidrug transport system fused ATPase/permease subunit
MALYLFAGYRLLPAIQALYASVSRVKFDSASLDTVHNQLLSIQEITRTRPSAREFQFRDKIQLIDVAHTYSGKSRPAVSGVNLSIAANGSFALVGRSGSGKSTLVDLILGLIPPHEGSILIDGVPIDSIGPDWQGQIGYVPQHIYLADDTVCRNIAFGVDPSEIDREAVVRAAGIADIHDYIETELDQGYDTIIGERGIRLSGGQRQRIGIARALYLDPSVLVLDEATSALDSTTENVIMEAIQRLGQKITIILIAHRMTTVVFCDWIYVLSDGRIVDQGNYQTLESKSAPFRELSLMQKESIDT